MRDWKKDSMPLPKVIRIKFIQNQIGKCFNINHINIGLNYFFNIQWRFSVKTVRINIPIGKIFFKKGVGVTKSLLKYTMWLSLLNGAVRVIYTASMPDKSNNTFFAPLSYKFYKPTIGYRGWKSILNFAVKFICKFCSQLHCITNTKSEVS